MKITILGAVGEVGSRIVSEALARGHDVTGVARAATQLARLPAEVRHQVADVSDARQLIRIAQGQDLLISAVRPPDGEEVALLAMTRSILDSVGDGQRILLVGGAARLRIPARNGETVLTAPDFLPAAAVAIARACQSQYEICLAETRAAWTYLSPPAMLSPGERTGRYRVGTDTLLVDENGASRISMEDFAVAVLDEAENAKHVRQAFTVGY